MKTALFISPHLDDAVLSCAGMISRLEHEGWQTVVVSVFTEGGNEHELRRAEDEAAAKLLGFDGVHLGFCDAPFREPGYLGLRDLLFGWRTEDHVTERVVADALLALRVSRRPEAVFVPMAAGTHVDHRIVHEAALAVGWGCEVSLYEDRPYTYAQGAVERRLGKALSEDASALYLSRWRELPFVTQYLPPGDEATLCQQLLLQDTSIAGVRCIDVSQATISQVVELNEAETVLCHEAARCYTSQYETFCGGDAQHALLDARHAQQSGSSAPRCERYWTITPPRSA
ncbi:MAG: PIG-L family deacetylase [Verrucomicrobiota bacterium]